MRFKVGDSVAVKYSGHSQSFVLSMHKYVGLITKVKTVYGYNSYSLEGCAYWTFTNKDIKKLKSLLEL